MHMQKSGGAAIIIALCVLTVAQIDLLASQGLCYGLCNADVLSRARGFRFSLIIDAPVVD